MLNRIKKPPLLTVNAYFIGENQYDRKRIVNEYKSKAKPGTHFIFPTVALSGNNSQEFLFRNPNNSVESNESYEIKGLSSLEFLATKHRICTLILYDYLDFSNAEIINLYRLVNNYKYDLQIIILERTIDKLCPQSFSIARTKKKGKALGSLIKKLPEEVVANYYCNFLTDPYTIPNFV